MRIAQRVGLTEKAQQIVVGEPTILYTETGRRVWADGRVEEYSHSVYGPAARKEETGRRTPGMGYDYDDLDGEPLYRYIFPDGRVLEEYVQDCPWSSGPCAFIALKEDGEPLPESLWPQAAISEYLQY